MSVAQLTTDFPTLAGDFWTSSLAPADRALLNAWQRAFYNGSHTSLDGIVQQAFEHDARRDLAWSYIPEHVIQIGGVIAHQAYTLMTDVRVVRVRPVLHLATVGAPAALEAAELELGLPHQRLKVMLQDSPSDLLPQWVIPCPAGLRAPAVESVKGLLVQGVDFLQGDGFIVVRQNPQTLWPSGHVAAREALCRRTPLLGWLAGADGEIDAHTEFLRSGSITAWARVVMAILGEHPGAGEAVSAIAGDSRQTSVFSDDWHTFPGQLTVTQGQTTRPLDSLEGGVRIRIPSLTYARWYRELDWSAGFRPNPIFDVVFPDQPVLFRAVATDTAGLVVRAPSLGTQAFWTAVRFGELAEGPTLATILGLAVEGDEVRVNPVDLFLDQLGAAQCMVCVELRKTYPADVLVRLQNYIERWHPLRLRPLILPAKI